MRIKHKDTMQKVNFPLYTANKRDKMSLVNLIEGYKDWIKERDTYDMDVYLESDSNLKPNEQVVV